MRHVRLTNELMRWLAAIAATGASLAAPSAMAAPLGEPSPPAPRFDTILYGVAYYNEYYPAAIRDARLDRDVTLMKQAGITVVRLGESSWSKWEPEDGKFDFAWMDRIVAAMGKAGIKVIMGTPTYSIPPWMYAKHPGMLARPLGGGETSYGMRQNMNIDDPDYRRYAERIIVALADHYRDNPNVIGWQLDNETSGYGASNPSVFADFVGTLKAKYKTPAALSEAWLLHYWGQDVGRWEDMPTPDKANSTSYKLEWSRFQQMRASRFIAWQAALVRQHARADQFLTSNHAGMSNSDVNSFQMDKVLNVSSNDIYFGWQDAYDGWADAYQGDLARSIKQRNYLVGETNAQTQGWSAQGQLPPYDGQMYQDVFSHIANGANLVSYWHWASIHGGQETYWKGVLSHDLEPNREYAEVSRVGHDLKRIGPKLANLSKANQVAILYSVDSANALRFMPFDHPEGTGGWGKPGVEGYGRAIERLHAALYRANIGTDIVYADNPDFSAYKLLIVPALYSADDALLTKISDFVAKGGHVIMTYKSGVTNENSLVRWEMAPGPLRKAAGFHYQEVSSLNQPLALKGDPFGVGTDNKVHGIAELLQVDTAEPLAYYDHPFFGKWPAITRNLYGKGSFVYEGTELSDGLQTALVADELKRLGLYGPDQQLPASVRIRHATAADGHKLHFLFNYSAAPVQAGYSYASATDLLTGKPVAPGQPIVLQPWGVVIARETK